MTEFVRHDLRVERIARRIRHTAARTGFVAVLTGATHIRNTTTLTSAQDVSEIVRLDSQFARKQLLVQLNVLRAIRVAQLGVGRVRVGGGREAELLTSHELQRDTQLALEQTTHSRESGDNLRIGRRLTAETRSVLVGARGGEFVDHMHVRATTGQKPGVTQPLVLLRLGREASWVKGVLVRQDVAHDGLRIRIHSIVTTVQVHVAGGEWVNIHRALRGKDLCMETMLCGVRNAGHAALLDRLQPENTNLRIRSCNFGAHDHCIWHGAEQFDCSIGKRQFNLATLGIKGIGDVFERNLVISSITRSHPGFSRASFEALPVPSAPAPMIPAVLISINPLKQT